MALRLNSSTQHNISILKSTAMATTFLLLASIVSLACSYPNGEEFKLNEIEGRAFGLSDVSDMKRDKVTVGDAITGLYTRVPLKTRWPNGVVPWEYSANLSTYTNEEKEIMEKTMKEISEIVCIKFVKKTNETSYVSFKNDEVGKCWSYVGYEPDSERQLNLASECLVGGNGTIIHELMHALGFEHEMTRYDRDLHVRIQWDNIKTTSAYNFAKIPRTYAFPQYPFDLGSLMMYRRFDFSINSKPAIVIMKNPNKVKLEDIGNTNGLSGTDASRINSAYKCGRGVSINSLGSMQDEERHSNFF